jgi:hypothetical protein
MQKPSSQWWGRRASRWRFELPRQLPQSQKGRWAHDCDFKHLENEQAMPSATSSCASGNHGVRHLCQSQLQHQRQAIERRRPSMPCPRRHTHILLSLSD